jgi:hypothetical protein
MDVQRTLSSIIDLLQALEDESRAAGMVRLARRLRRHRAALAGLAISLWRHTVEEGAI